MSLCIILDDYCFKVRNVCSLERFLSSICFLSVIYSSKVLFYLNEVSVFIVFNFLDNHKQKY